MLNRGVTRIVKDKRKWYHNCGQRLRKSKGGFARLTKKISYSNLDCLSVTLGYFVILFVSLVKKKSCKMAYS